MATLDDYRNQLLTILGPQAPIEATKEQKLVSTSLSNDDFPVPGLLFIAFQEILGLKRFGPFEKLAWAFEWSFQGTRVSVSLEKVGLRLHCPDTIETASVEQALKKCCRIAEHYLKPFVADSLNDAKVTLDNHYGRFDGAYTYFRCAAREAYDAPPPEPVVTKTPFGTVTSFSPFRSMQQGGYLASAMLDAYFSKLEHTLVLMAPFTQLDLTNGALRRLVGSNWGDKFKLLFDIATDRSAKTIYDELTRIKEAFRNPTAHGGFLKKGASFHFHSAAGVLPVLLTRTNRDFEMTITPVPPAKFEDICDVLDRADAFIESSFLSDAFTYVKSGLPVAVDDGSRAKYSAAMNGECFDDFLDYEASVYDRHMNMDY